MSVDSQKHNIESLLCGSRYQVYATGFNKSVAINPVTPYRPI